MIDKDERFDDGIEESYLNDDEELDDIDYTALYASAMENASRDNEHHKKRVWIPAVIIVFLAAILTFIGTRVYQNKPSKEIVDLDGYFENEYGMTLYVNYEKTDVKLIKQDGYFYLPESFFDANLTDKFYFDRGNRAVIYTTSENIYTIPMNSKNYLVDGENQYADYVIATISGDEVYVAINFLYGKAGFSYSIYENPDRIALVYDKEEYQVVSVSSKGVVRQEPSIKSPYFANEIEGSVWVVFGEPENGWQPVRSEDGRNGYVKLSQIEPDANRLVYDSFYVPEHYESISKDYKIFLAWHAVNTADNNSKIESLLKDTKGITTISPTWYKAIDAEGNIESLADAEYVKKVHEMGYEIWPLISDFTATGENGWSEKELFSNTASRRKLIDNIMNEIKTYGYDGFNIDFELVPRAAGEDFIQFIRELSIRMRAEKVVLSIDNYVPTESKMHYNRKAQGECADYVIVMSYDEHWSTCKEAGSVASLPFVVSGVENTLKEVSADKLINAVPFYTRLWINQKDENGEMKLTSKSYSMQGGYDVVDKYELREEWDSELGQHVAKGNVGDVEYSIWLEDCDSMKARMEAIKDYNLVGTAAWRLGFESNTIWDVFEQYK